jgi:hypothetical protein
LARNCAARRSDDEPTVQPRGRSARVFAFERGDDPEPFGQPGGDVLHRMYGDVDGAGE